MSLLLHVPVGLRARWLRPHFQGADTSRGAWKPSTLKQSSLCLEPELSQPGWGSRPSCARAQEWAGLGLISGFPGSTSRFRQPCFSPLITWSFFQINRSQNNMSTQGVVVRPAPARKTVMVIRSCVSPGFILLCFVLVQIAAAKDLFPAASLRPLAHFTL